MSTVNGEYITLAEFEAELARYKLSQTSLGITVSEEEANKVVLEDMIAQVLLSQAAREGNFTLTEPDLNSRINSLAESIGGPEALSAWKSAHGYDDASFQIALKRSAEAAWMRDKIIADVPTSMEQIHLRQILTYNEADAQRHWLNSPLELNLMNWRRAMTRSQAVSWVGYRKVICWMPAPTKPSLLYKQAR